MNSKKLKILKKNLITFLTIFDGKPNILAEYLLQYEVLDDKIINFIINNKELSKKSKELKDTGEIEPPFFNSIEEIQQYYNTFFIEKECINALLGSETKEESLIIELKKALEKEDYELATKIRNYCYENNIDMENFFK